MHVPKENVSHHVFLPEAVDPVAWAPTATVLDCDGEARRVVLRALGPDNRADLKKLVQLFTSYFDAGYAFDGVFDLEYWHSQVSAAEAAPSLVSIVADQEGDFIAHLALWFDPTKQRVEILYPAIHPRFASQLLELSQLFWNKMEQLACRQQWSLAYQYSPLSEAPLQLISSKYFESFEMALIPHLANGTSRPDPLVLMYRFFSPWSEQLRYLYPPPHHSEKVQELYSSLGLPRIFVCADTAILLEGATDSVELALTAGRSLALPRRFGVKEVTLRGDEPAGSLPTLVEPAGRCLLRIPLHLSSCPALSAAAETFGYRLVGIQPVVGEGDYLLYAVLNRAALRNAQLTTPRGRSLQAYLLRHTV